MSKKQWWRIWGSDGVAEESENTTPKEKEEPIEKIASRGILPKNMKILSLSAWLDKFYHKEMRDRKNTFMNSGYLDVKEVRLDGVLYKKVNYNDPSTSKIDTICVLPDDVFVTFVPNFSAPYRSGINPNNFELHSGWFIGSQEDIKTLNALVLSLEENMKSAVEVINDFLET